MSLRELYQEIIIDHGKQPRNKGRLENPSHSQVGHNPLCGDRLIVDVIMHDNTVQKICFEGAGCAISMASASLMSEIIQGKTIHEFETLFQHFHHLVTATNKEETGVEIGKLIAFSGVSEFPARVKCATLAWHTLKAALINQVDAVSTE